MKKFDLFILLAIMLLAVGCESEVNDQKTERPVIKDGQASITIMGDSMITTRSTNGRVEFAGGYATGAGLYDGDADAVVEAVPYSGYQLVNFTGGPTDGSSNQFSGDNRYSFNIQRKDWKFSVSFKKEYTIAVSAGTGGSASGGGTVLEGESCTVNASAYSGYSFEGWDEGGTKVSSSASYTFTVSSNRTLYLYLT